MGIGVNIGLDNSIDTHKCVYWTGSLCLEEKGSLSLENRRKDRGHGPWLDMEDKQNGKHVVEETENVLLFGSQRLMCNVSVFSCLEVREALTGGMVEPMLPTTILHLARVKLSEFVLLWTVCIVSTC